MQAIQNFQWAIKIVIPCFHYIMVHLFTVPNFSVFEKVMPPDQLSIEVPDLHHFLEYEMHIMVCLTKGQFCSKSIVMYPRTKPSGQQALLYNTTSNMCILIIIIVIKPIHPLNRITSRINANEFVPFLDIDKKEAFVLSPIFR